MRVVLDILRNLELPLNLAARTILISLGIIDRLGGISHMTALTLNDMKPQIKEIAFGFAAKASS